jgi:hypothetical protein
MPYFVNSLERGGFLQMMRWLLRGIGLHLFKQAVIGGKRPPLLDMGLGFALLKDRRVPASTRAMALVLGAAATAALIAVELPVEALIALFFNVPGLGFDIALDGLEALAGPLLFGSLLISRLAPRNVVERARAERAGAWPPASPAPRHGNALLRRV